MSDIKRVRRVPKHPRGVTTLRRQGPNYIMTIPQETMRVIPFTEGQLFVASYDHVRDQICLTPISAADDSHE